MTGQIWRRWIAVVASVVVVGTLVSPAMAGPDPRWRRRFVGDVSDMAVDGRGNTYAVGSKLVDVGAGRYWRAVLTKYGPDGRQKWRKLWGPDRGSAFGATVDVGPNGSVLIAGSIESEVLCSGWYLRAYRPGGVVRWHRAQSGADGCDHSDSARSVAAGADSILVAGNAHADGVGAVEGWLLSFTPAGRLQWRRSFDVPGVPASWFDSVWDVDVGGLGSIYVVGGVAPRREFGPGSYERVVQKRSASGAVIWSRVLTDRDRHPDDIDLATSVDVLGKRLVVGGSVNKPGWRRPAAWVARYSFGGALLMERYTPGRGHVTIALARDGATFAAWWSGEGTVLTKLGPRLGFVWRNLLPEQGSSALAVGAGGVSASSSSGVRRDWDYIWRFRA